MEKQATPNLKKYALLPATLLTILVLLTSCGGSSVSINNKDKPLYFKPYNVQVGSFQNVNSAVNLQLKLNNINVDAYYFKGESGQYHVMFGNFFTEFQATKYARKYKKDGLYDNFTIVTPIYTPGEILSAGTKNRARRDITASAGSYIGTPYLWGGTNSSTGFDCSGLTYTVYAQNGFQLPRVAAEQFKQGNYVPRNRLREGDLVFFATSGGKKASHVGIYIGNNNFIHAPSSGKNVQTTSMDNPYFKKIYLGARSYI